MSFVISTFAEQRTVLNNISWQTFEVLLKEAGEARGSHFAYDDGILEIMAPLFEHESPKINLDRFVFILAEELDIEIKSAGSMTLKREDLRKGIEPDNCYYVQNEPLVRVRRQLDLANDPPPDLAIEINITSSFVNKLGIYSALGLRELWRYDGRLLMFYELVNEGYVEREFSVAFGLVSCGDLSRFIEQSMAGGEMAVLKAFREWVRGKI